jgi:predicted nucleotide-binding protein
MGQSILSTDEATVPSRRTTNQPPQSPVLSPDQVRRRIERLQKCIEELEAFDPQQVQKRYNITEVVALETSITDALGAAFGHGTARFNLYKDAANLDQGPHTVRLAPAFGRGSVQDYDAQEAHEARQYLADGKKRSISLLQLAIRTLEDDIADQEKSDQPTSAPSKNKVFVVHGHDETALQGVARFLEQLGLEAIVLREQPDQGRATIEKFEHYAARVGFAVVLLTPDDIGTSSVTASAARARQNVIFELGYFSGKLGRGRACLLRKGDVEIPSDLYGVIYTDLDATGGWKIKLVQELKAAGLEFDANKTWS